MPIHILTKFITTRQRHDKWQYQPSWGHTP